MCGSDADQLRRMCGKSDTSGAIGTGDESPFKSWDFGLGLVCGCMISWKNTLIISASFPQKFLEGLQEGTVSKVPGFNAENANSACKEMDRSNSTVLFY